MLMTKEVIKWIKNPRTELNIQGMIIDKDRAVELIKKESKEAFDNLSIQDKTLQMDIIDKCALERDAKSERTFIGKVYREKTFRAIVLTCACMCARVTYQRPNEKDSALRDLAVKCKSYRARHILGVDSPYWYQKRMRTMS